MLFVVLAFSVVDGSSLRLGVSLGDAFAVFGEDFFGVLVEGLFAAGAADVVGLAFVGDVDRPFAAGDDAFGAVGPFDGETRAFAGVADLRHAERDAGGGSLSSRRARSSAFR